MTLLKKLDNWSEEFHHQWMDALRVMLGMALMIKGFIFISDTSALQRMMDVNFGIETLGVVYFISFMHLFTGFLILIGAGTRISCLLQLPIIMAAIFWVNAKQGPNTLEFLFSFIVLVLLVFFLFKGSGKFSAYYYLANSKASRKTDESRVEFHDAPLNSPMDTKGNLIPGKTKI